MFTGIVETVGQVASLASRGQDLQMAIVSDDLDLTDVKSGDSIAINGVCLTVVGLQQKGFDVDVSAETLSCTTFTDLAAGAPVNLEKALLPTTRLGGHLVSGHVDAIACVTDCHDDGRSLRLTIETPAELTRYLAAKGSVCVDGVSLTINTVQEHCFTVNIIPHTRESTIIGHYRPGTRVNIEVDIIARYLERLLLGDNGAITAVDRELLRRTGFADTRS
jgi:riboflavin synthase